MTTIRPDKAQAATRHQTPPSADGDQRKPPSFPPRFESRPPLPSGGGIKTRHTLGPKKAGGVTRARGATLAYAFQSSPGMIRRMNSSNMGTVKAVSPWLGLQIMPLAIN
jgi:hypothetical protein